MSEAITTPAPDICVECGDVLEQCLEAIIWGRGPKPRVKRKKIILHQWFRVEDDTGPLCRACAYGEEVEG
jgi:hypothetical protein